MLIMTIAAASPTYFSRRSCRLSLLWLLPIQPIGCLASFFKREPHWSFITDDSLGSLYMSEDESEERVLSALAAVSFDDDYCDDNHSLQSLPSYDMTESVKENHDEHVQDIRIESVQASMPEQQNKVSYVTIPETYRAKPSHCSKTSVAVSPPLSPVSKTGKKAQSIATASPTSMSPWIRQFLASCPGDALLPLPLDFLLDNFNLAQLAPVIERIAHEGLSDTERQQLLEDLDSTQPYPVYRRALDLLVQQRSPDNISPMQDVIDLPPPLERATRALYFLLHQRFCLSPRGLDMVHRRFMGARHPALIKAASDTTRPTRITIFGDCPSCPNVALLPFGVSDNVKVLNNERANSTRTINGCHTCKRYCCNCRKYFVYRGSKVDGCAWGPSFCHLYIMTFGTQSLMKGSDRTRNVADKSSRRKLSRMYTDGQSGDATVFGFRLHWSSEQ